MKCDICFENLQHTKKCINKCSLNVCLKCILKLKTCPQCRSNITYSYPILEPNVVLVPNTPDTLPPQQTISLFAKIFGVFIVTLFIIILFNTFRIIIYNS